MASLATPRTEPTRSGRICGFDLVGGVCALVAAGGLLAEYAFFEPPVDVAWCRLAEVLAVVGFLAARIKANPGTGAAGVLRRYWLDLAVLPAGAILALTRGAPALPAAIHAGAIYLVIRQAGIACQAILERAVLCVVMPHTRRRAIRLIIGTYLSIAVLGGAMLALPKATTADHRNSPYTHLLNSAFAATSAVCGSGLNVYKLPGDYTVFGQTVILGLVQVGALGMLIFGTLFGMLLARRLRDEADAAWADATRVRRIIAAIVAVALGLEAIGAVLLYSMYADVPAGLPRAFHAIFQAVSAFCNTGFLLEKDSLVGRGGLWQVYGVILPLAVLGSLGFPVLYELVHKLTGRKGDRTAMLPLPSQGWSLHTRLVLTTALCLAVGGALAMLYFETPGRIGYWYVGKGNLLSQEESVQLSGDWMRSHEGPQRLFDAAFQSTVSPTAGQETVPIEPGAISPASQCLLMFLMFVGGGPASTAGGIKVISLAVIVLYVRSILRKGRPQSGDRAVSSESIRLVLGLFFVSAAWLALTVLALTHSERADFLKVAFEAVSAFSNGGLSLGLTHNLTALGKGIILVTMLIGRTGPLILVLALADLEPAMEDRGEPVVLA